MKKVLLFCFPIKVGTSSFLFCSLKGRDQPMCWENKCILYRKLYFNRLKNNSRLKNTQKALQIIGDKLCPYAPHFYL